MFDYLPGKPGGPDFPWKLHVRNKLLRTIISNLQFDQIDLPLLLNLHWRKYYNKNSFNFWNYALILPWGPVKPAKWKRMTLEINVFHSKLYHYLHGLSRLDFHALLLRQQHPNLLSYFNIKQKALLFYFLIVYRRSHCTRSTLKSIKII